MYENDNILSVFIKSRLVNKTDTLYTFEQLRHARNRWCENVG